MCLPLFYHFSYTGGYLLRGEIKLSVFFDKSKAKNSKDAKKIIKKAVKREKTGKEQRKKSIL